MFTGKSVLIAEDEPIIAMDLADAVETAGGVVIGPCDTVGETLQLIGRQRVAAAIIDANLLDRDVTPVGRLLVARRVPTVVYSGTGLPDELKLYHPELPVVFKPTPPAHLVLTLFGAMQRRPDRSFANSARRNERLAARDGAPAAYFLHRKTPTGYIADPDGSVLPSLDAAFEEALASARNLWAEAIVTQQDLSGHSFEIMDGAGHLLLSVPFVDALPPGMCR